MKLLSHVQLLVTLQTVARRAPLSMGFSRQEYCSGLPFPSPEDLPNPGIEPRSPTLQADSLPAEPQGKPKNTGVGSLSLLQGIFPTQELNQGLLHCRQILYQLSYEGSPVVPKQFTCNYHWPANLIILPQLYFLDVYLKHRLQTLRFLKDML